MVTTRHELLTALHDLLRPITYLETGVQYGASLNLAIHSSLAIGIDPNPLTGERFNQKIYRMLSDDYFVYHMAPEERVDFAFIDGSHLVEDALRDFINIELHSHGKTVVVFDDVLPLNTDMTSRTMIPGHWTGDVWKIVPILRQYRPDLKLVLVDTEPTGTLVVLNLNRYNKTLPLQYSQAIDGMTEAAILPVPEEILNRQTALPPDLALHTVEQWLSESLQELT